jgi:DNA-binding MarR family transcriptional regulator
MFFITLPGISKRFDRLSERGLLERRPDPHDGRVEQKIRKTA